MDATIKRICPGLYTAIDQQNRCWTIEYRDDLRGWVASCDSVRDLFSDPFDTLREAKAFVGFAY